VCPDVVFKSALKSMGEADRDVVDGLVLHLAKPYQTLTFGKYSVTPLPARHSLGNDAVFYMVSDGDKTLLYAHDSGFFYPEVFEYIKERKLYFDCVTLDCTNAHLPSEETACHMGLDNVEKTLNVFREIGAIDKDSKLFVNHFSHNGDPIHSKMEKSAKKIGCDVAFDGCTVEF